MTCSGAGGRFRLRNGSPPVRCSGSARCDAEPRSLRIRSPLVPLGSRRGRHPGASRKHRAGHPPLHLPGPLRDGRRPVVRHLQPTRPWSPAGSQGPEALRASPSDGRGTGAATPRRCSSMNLPALPWVPSPSSGAAPRAPVSDTSGSTAVSSLATSGCWAATRATWCRSRPSPKPARRWGSYWWPARVPLPLTGPILMPQGSAAHVTETVKVT